MRDALVNNKPALLSAEEAMTLSWIRFVEAMGFIEIGQFAKMPSRLVNTVIAIKRADQLIELKESYVSTTDTAEKQNIFNNIADLEKFFNG